MSEARKRVYLALDREAARLPLNDVLFGTLIRLALLADHKSGFVARSVRELAGDLAVKDDRRLRNRIDQLHEMGFVEWVRSPNQHGGALWIRCLDRLDARWSGADAGAGRSSAADDAGAGRSSAADDSGAGRSSGADVGADAGAGRSSAAVGTNPEGDFETSRQPLAAASPTPRKELREAIAKVCGINLGELTSSARGKLNRATKELDEVEATPKEIERRAKVWREKFPTAELTAAALALHWSRLGGKLRLGAAGRDLGPDDVDEEASARDDGEAFDEPAHLAATEPLDRSEVPKAVPEAEDHPAAAGSAPEPRPGAAGSGVDGQDGEAFKGFSTNLLAEGARRWLAGRRWPAFLGVPAGEESWRERLAVVDDRSDADRRSNYEALLSRIRAVEFLRDRVNGTARPLRELLDSARAEGIAEADLALPLAAEFLKIPHWRDDRGKVWLGPKPPRDGRGPGPTVEALESAARSESPDEPVAEHIDLDQSDEMSEERSMLCASCGRSAGNHAHGCSEVVEAERRGVRAAIV